MQLTIFLFVLAIFLASIWVFGLRIIDVLETIARILDINKIPQHGDGGGKGKK